jgi:serine/threonine protein kinase
MEKGSFGFATGDILAGRYQIVSHLGGGWEGEVYLLRERGTGIERAGKFFYPARNKGNATLLRYAKKLYRLRDCDILIHYGAQERAEVGGKVVSFLISEYVEGERLSAYLARQPKKRLTPFQGLHLLHALATGLTPIHERREYHGDLHTDNIILTRVGLSYHVKLIDLYHRGESSSAENVFGDVCDLIRIFYEAVGGRKIYKSLPPEIKQIVCGLKRSLIRKKFKTSGRLRRYLETMSLDI